MYVCTVKGRYNQTCPTKPNTTVCKTYPNVSPLDSNVITI